MNGNLAPDNALLMNGAHRYPETHWREIQRFVVGNERDSKDLFNLADDLWEARSEEHTSELQSQSNLVCRLLLEKKKNQDRKTLSTNGMVNANVGPAVSATIPEST